MRQDLPTDNHVLQQRAGQSKLLSRLYRDVGLAAVAAELDLEQRVAARAFEMQPTLLERVMPQITHRQVREIHPDVADQHLALLGDRHDGG